MATATPAPGRPPATHYVRLALLGALIGVPAAFVAALFLGVVHILEHWLWHDLPHRLGSDTPQWYLVIGLPVAGACVVALARLLFPGDGGHEPLAGLTGGPTLISYFPGVALAAIGTLAFGAVLGPEGPLIALGSIVGLVIGRYASREPRDPRDNLVYGTAGSFSSISALFGGPIVAGVLMMEATSGAGAAGAALLVPGFVAAAEGYLIIEGFGGWGGLDVPGLAVPGLPHYDDIHAKDLIAAVVVGVVAALVITAVRQLATRIAEARKNETAEKAATPRSRKVWFLLAGGLAVGIVAQVADILGANSQDVLFSGQASVAALSGSSSTKIVLILLVGKGLGYAICLGCGFRGGPVFPAIFLGIALMAFGVVWFDISPTVAVGAGAAAGMTAMTRMLLTPMFFAALLVGSAGIQAAPLAVLAGAASWLMMDVLDHVVGQRSIAAESVASTST